MLPSISTGETRIAETGVPGLLPYDEIVWRRRICSTVGAGTKPFVDEAGGVRVVAVEPVWPYVEKAVQEIKAKTANTFSKALNNFKRVPLLKWRCITIKNWTCRKDLAEAPSRRGAEKYFGKACSIYRV
jgi:hypothetical protein